MRKHFYFILSLLFWLFMAIGFSDNWLFDTDQPSNSSPRLLIHAFFAFSWFTLLVIQTGLIRKHQLALHMKTGIAGMVVYAGFLLTTLPMYWSEFAEHGYLAPLSLMIFLQLIYGSVLIITAFMKRKSDTPAHKANMLFGTFMLIQPAVDRAVGHLFGTIGLPWLLIYVVLFSLFIWYYKKLSWQIAIGFLIWLGGLVNVIRHMG